MKTPLANSVTAGFLAAEEEFDENGRLVIAASSERERDQGPFRSVYHYDANGRLSEEYHFNRDGSPAGRKHYVYDSAEKKTEELFYAASGVLLSRARYDENTLRWQSQEAARIDVAEL